VLTANAETEQSRGHGIVLQNARNCENMHRTLQCQPGRNWRRKILARREKLPASVLMHDFYDSGFRRVEYYGCRGRIPDHVKPDANSVKVLRTASLKRPAQSWGRRVGTPESDRYSDARCPS